MLDLIHILIYIHFGSSPSLASSRAPGALIFRNL